MLLIPLCPRTLDIACLTVFSVWGKKGLFWLQAKPTWSAFRAKAKHTKGVDPLLTSTFPARFCYYDVVCRRQKRPSGKYAFFRSLDLCSDKPLGQLAAGGSLVKAAKEGLDILHHFLSSIFSLSHSFLPLSSLFLFVSSCCPTFHFDVLPIP